MSTFNRPLMRSHLQTKHPHLKSRQLDALLDELQDRFDQEQRKARAVANAKSLSYGEWLRSRFPSWDWESLVYARLIDIVQRVIDGELTQVIINVSPRVGKSSLVTERLPAYWLGQRPQDGIIVGAYSKELATFFTGAALDNYKLDNASLVDSERQEEWNNIYGGFVKGVGVGSGVTGRGCECLLAGTMIAVEGGSVPIERIAPGDRVLCEYGDERCERGYRPVVAVSRSVTKRLVAVLTAEDAIHCTPDHPVYAMSYEGGYGWTEGWKDAGDLKINDHVLTILGWRRIVAALPYECAPVTVYNLQVEEVETYFANNILVHNCLIIDDPVRSYAEAHSPAYQKLVWNWWLNDVRTRRNNLGNTPTLLIMTRWSEEDLTGKILAGPNASDWTVFSIPALAHDPNDINPTTMEPFGPDPLGRKPGESVLPHRMSVKDLNQLQIEMGTDFDGLYQQIPHSAARHSFDTTKIKVISHTAPLDAFRVRFFDRAGSAGKGDWTVGALLAVDDNGFVYIEDIVRGQWGDEGVDAVMDQTIKLDYPKYGKNGFYQFWFEQEPASSGKAIANQTIRKFAGYEAYADRPSDNKSVRSKPWASFVNSGNVYMVEGDWNKAFLDEMRRYIAFGPANQTDDQVDASSGAFMKLTVERLDVSMA